MFNRRDAETQRNIGYRRAERIRFQSSPSRHFFFALVLCVSAVNLSCNSKPTDLRTLAQAETLVYLETNDLGAALQPIVDSKPFNEVAKKKPDFSALKGVQLAVAVTGFETSEEKLTDEHSVGRVQPHFVAIADTHAWNYQAVAFAEQKLGGFVEKVYDSPPTLERSDKKDGKYFTWTAKDGRKAYALVIDSLIYFGNDESAIDKALAVRRGETDNIAKTGKVPPSAPGTLSSGYVSTDGIAQIANLIGLKFASEAGDDSEVQSAIAGILPQLLRSSITDISWTATKTEQGIEDKYKITMPPGIAKVFNETMAPGSETSASELTQLPVDVSSVTVYNFKEPQIAWRSVLLTAQKLANPLAGKAFGAFPTVVFEPYGIRDPEVFLSSVGTPIVTAKFDAEGDRSIVIASVKDPAKIKTSLLVDIKPDKKPYPNFGYEHWTSTDADLAAAFPNPWVVVGDTDGVARCLSERPDGGFGFAVNGKFFYQNKAAIVTYGTDATSVLPLVEMLAHEGNGDTKAVSTYYIETRFTRTGIERRSVSDFGLIGSIIAQLADN